MKDLGDQNLTLLESGRKAAAKAALDDLEGDKEVKIEALSTGEVEASINAPIQKGWFKGGTVSAFARTKVQQAKDVGAGFRISKKF